MTPRSRLRAIDLLRAAIVGLTGRRSRTALTVTGIAIGAAVITAILVVSNSSRASILTEIDKLGTDILTVEAGETTTGEPSLLPTSAQPMLGRLDGIESATAVTELPVSVYRNDLIPEGETNGISVLAADHDLPAVVGIIVDRGRFYTHSDDPIPVVALGAVAAQRLGIISLAGNPKVIIDGTWFAVVAVLEPSALNPDLDRSVMIPPAMASQLTGEETKPSRVYLRFDREQIERVRPLLARTAYPLRPNEVRVAQPSQALDARDVVSTQLHALLLALGVVALIIGAIGIANTMIISVVERRTEIGLRRSLGATRSSIASQFIAESTLVSAAGAAIGAVIGIASARAYAQSQNWVVETPATQLLAALGASLAVGLLAGILPAIKAARLDPALAVHPI